MSSTGRLARIVLLVLALGGLVVAWLGRSPGAAGEPMLLLTLGFFGLGAALLRPAGVASLGVGAFLVAPALQTARVFEAGILVAGVVLCRETLLWLVTSDDGEEEGRLFELFSAAGPVVIATLGAGWMGRVLPEATAGVRADTAAAAVYLVLLAAAGWLEAASEGARLPARLDHLRPLGLEALGWGLGVSLAAVIRRLGWAEASVLGLGITILSLVAVFFDLRARGERMKVERLTELHLAGHRIIFRQADLLSIARQIHAECKRVLRFSWFQLELARSDGTLKSWFAGPEGIIHSGEPEVPPAPRPLPGIHRRASWRRIERDLSNAERTFGHLRLWCDPRLLDPHAVEWLDSLLPQMVSSIERTFLDREAREDPLTGLPDRRVLEARLGRAFDLCLEEGRPMAVVMCDLDRFKKINDRYGHTAGDQALMLVAQLLESHRRDGDVCCRYGGEEFALVLDDADGVTALAVAERMRRAVELAIMEVDFKKLPLRISAGIASYPELHVKEANELVELADAALYEAKRQGRNRCLLNMGKGRFRRTDGTILDPEKPAPKIEPPTLFA